MPFINELGFVEHSIQEKVERLLLKNSPKRIQCKYCLKNMSVDAFRLVGTQLLFLYQNCRYLFEGVQYRNLYDHNFMFQQYNSQTCQIFIQALRPVYVQLLQNKYNEQLFDDVAQITQATLSATLDTCVAYCTDAEHFLALAEVVEAFQSPVGNEFRQKIIDDTDPVLVLQLKS